MRDPQKKKESMQKESDENLFGIQRNVQKK